MRWGFPKFPGFRISSTSMSKARTPLYQERLNANITMCVVYNRVFLENSVEKLWIPQDSSSIDNEIIVGTFFNDGKLAPCFFHLYNANFVFSSSTPEYYILLFAALPHENAVAYSLKLSTHFQTSCTKKSYY